jgi:hypothetical protein
MTSRNLVKKSKLRYLLMFVYTNIPVMSSFFYFEFLPTFDVFSRHESNE